MSVLDWDRQFALEQAAEDAELLQELIDIFKDSFNSDLCLLKEGLLEKDGAIKICRAAHSIKGASASLGIKGINKIALSIEEESRNGGVSVARENLALLEAMGEELAKL
jgi:HPt (histidine-containing phosphotransfer) domain-containing protein